MIKISKIISGGQRTARKRTRSIYFGRSRGRLSGNIFIAEIALEFTDKVILLADMRDGKMLDTKNGAWQIIVSDEKKHGRWVRHVTELKINKIQ